MGRTLHVCHTAVDDVDLFIFEVTCSTPQVSALLLNFSSQEVRERHT